MDINKLAKALVDADGTYNQLGQRVEYEHGYQVGGYVPTLVIEPKPEAVGDLKAWLRKHAGRSGSFGSWTDDRGRIHVDLTHHFRTLIYAVKVAESHNEQAIWSWDLGAAIYLYPGT